MKDILIATVKKNRIFVILGTLVMAAVVLFGALSTGQGTQSVASFDNGVLTLNSDTPGFVQSFQADNRNITGIKLYVDEVAQSAEGTLSIAVYASEEAAMEADKGNAVVYTEAALSNVSNGSECTYSVEKSKLNPGHRYYLRVSLSDISVGTSLSVKTWSDHGGLTVLDAKGNMNETDGAVRCEVLYSRATNLAFLVRLFIAFGGIAIILAIYFNKTWDDMFVVAFGIVCIWLMLCGVFGILNPGIYILMILSSVFLIASPLLLKIKEKSIKDIITPGFVAIWALMLIYFIFDRNIICSKVDDLNHWMLTVTDMWYSDSFAFHAGSVVEFPRYTPAASVIEYLFLRLAGYYREGLILYALNALGFVYFAIFFSKIKWKQCHKAIPAALLAVCMPTLIYGSHFNYLHVDAYLGIVGAYMLICWFTEEETTIFNVFRIAIAGIVLSMIKESGYVIAMTNWLIIALDIFYHTYNKDRKKMWAKKEKTWMAFRGAIATLLSYPLWNVYCVIMGGAKNSGITTVFKKVLGLGALMVQAAETGQPAITQSASPGANPDTSPLNVIKELLHWMLRQKDYMNKSFVDVFLLLVVFVMLLSFCGVFKPIRLRMKTIIIYLIFGTGIYTAFMALCYMTLFKEGSAIPAARRYMGTYLLLLMITVLGAIVVRLNQTAYNIEITDGTEKDNGSSLRMPLLTMFFIWFSAIFVFLSLPNGHLLYMKAEIGDEMYQQWESNRVLRETIRSFAEEGEKMYFVSYEDSTIVPKYNYLMFFNAIAPVHAQGIYGGWKPVEEYEEQYYTYAKIMTCDEWAQKLAKEYNYVYLHDIDDYFPKHYGSLFENYDDIMNGGIYKVVVNEGNVTLRKIAYKDVN